ncbi:MAG: Ig-like domain-containing protein [Tannerella sp.]|nr:Ig-like domain-containing protein [Tannerella sp.]
MIIIKKYKYVSALALALIALFTALSCANIGNPNGGDYDYDPPKFIGSKPAPNQLNFKGKEIVVMFDEFVTIENPSENVIVTPPQKQNPTVQGLGKKIRVQLKDTLLENTTYTIDFTSSISDNNEKIVLENFSFAFSTGDVLDTMKIGGRLIDAENLEPVQKTVVGIHKDLSDTAFTKIPLLRASKTDESGRFVIHNITPGEYHVFAIEDKNRNYAYDKNGDEGLAFLDTVVQPFAQREFVPDTIWKDTITVDTVMMVEKTIFYPNDLVLWYFKDSIAPRQRLLKPDRPQEFILTLKFNAPMDTFPVPQPINFEPVDSVWYVPQKAEDAESFAINYWILDTMIYKMDTLKISVTYWKNNDSIPDLLELRTDTINLVSKANTNAKKKPQKQKRPPKVRPNNEGSKDSIGKEEEKTPVVPLQVSISPTGALNPEDIITIKFNEPVSDVKKEYFKLELGRDTLWDAADFEFVADSTVAMTYYVKHTLKYDERYRLLIDSAVFCSVYGHCNEKAAINFTVKSEKDYGHLFVTIQGLPHMNRETETMNQDSLNIDSLSPAPENLNSEMIPAYMELLNSSGSPVRRAIVKNGVATFMNMTPEKYYARIILDTNGNGKWDAGNYEEKKQPERVIYFMKQYEIPQNWKVEETWDISTARLGEKPEVLIKNKPKEKMNKKRDYREESNPKRGGSSSSGIRGIPF